MYSEDFSPPYGAFRGGYGGRRGRGRGRGFSYDGYGPGGGAWPGRGRRSGGGRWALLSLLKAESPRSGAQLLRALEARSFGRWFPDPAVVQGMLGQLEDEGLVRGRDGGGEFGRAYELTEAGAAYVDRLNDAAGPWALPSAEAFALHRAVRATSAAARQVALNGGGEASAEAARLLDETCKQLYRLLADDAR